MSTTTGTVSINQSDGWVEVIDRAGFVTINGKNFFQFIYKSTRPTATEVGNEPPAENRVITCNTGSKLWVKSNGYMLTVVVNQE